MKDKFISQGHIYICDFSGAKGSEQKSTRPALVVQNNIGNTFSTTTWVIPITSKNKKEYPMHHIIYQKDYPQLEYEENIILVEQLTTRDECRIGKYIGKR